MSRDRAWRLRFGSSFPGTAGRSRLGRPQASCTFCGDFWHSQKHIRALSPTSVVGDERVRLFCALPLPADAVETLVCWQEEQLSGVAGARLVGRENLHVTLAFLGSTPADRVDEVVGSLGEAARGVKGRIVLRVREYRETRSVGMLVFEDEGGRAAGLAGGLQARLEALSLYRPEKRAWLAHLTVLRFRARPRVKPPLPDLGRVSPSEAALYHSVLRPGGAQHVTVESVVLGG